MASHYNICRWRKVVEAPSVVVLLALLSAVSPLFAQTDTVRTRLNEVSVVGVKQTASTDLSVSTLITADEIQRMNMVTMKDASRLVPNFFMPQYGSRMTSSIYVRGLGARIDQPVVGLSVDNVPYLNKDNYDFDMMDISRIEVLRGAQSILNGRNTMAGQVNIHTLSPWQYQGWRLMAEYGRANSVKAGIGWYNRVNDAVATSVTGYYTMTDGFFRNEYNGSRLDTEKQGSLRWKLSWHPSTRIALTNTASAQINRQGGYPYEHLATGMIAYNDTCFYRRTSFTDGLTVGWTGKRVTVTSVTSVQYLDDNMTLDQDFRPVPYFTLSQKRKEWVGTEDLYCKGTRGNLNWLGGVFGFVKHTDMSAPVTFKDDGITNLIEAHPNQMNPAYPVRWDEREFVMGSDFTTVTKGVAAYGQSCYDMGPWKFELGLRLDIERADLDYWSHCNTSYTIYHRESGELLNPYKHVPVKIDDHGKLHHTYVQLLPKVAVGYTFDSGVNLFANVAKGYKSGGFNVQMFSDVLQQTIMEMMGVTKLYDINDIISYKPEKSWNFELGMKAPMSDRLDLNASLFYISCIDQQLTAFPAGLTTGRIMTNAGRTHSYGAEFTVDWRPADALQVNASYGYTNARFRRYNDGKADYAGKRLPYAPQNTAFVSVAYTLPIQICGLVPELDVSARGVGDIYWDDANSVCQPFYMTLASSLTLQHNAWSLRLWGENITNTRYNTFYFVSVSQTFVQRANPVTYGVTLRLQL